MSDFLAEEELLAAIDMGSNSFHLAIARLDHGEVRKVASMSEKVQLAAGLDENNHLNEAAQQRVHAVLLVECYAAGDAVVFLQRFQTSAEQLLEHGFF